MKKRLSSGRVDGSIGPLREPKKDLFGKRDFRLLSKEQLSHLRTELNFAYSYAIRWELIVPFIQTIGGYEIISARKVFDGYPLFEEPWLIKMQDALHPSYLKMKASEDSVFLGRRRGRKR